MLTYEALAVTGFAGRPVPTSFIRQPGDSSHLAVILPGYLHSVDRPDLHYAMRILAAHGADVLRIEYRYWLPEYRAMAESERDSSLAQDARAATEAGMRQRSYDRLTLVGKSLGTVAIAHLLEDAAYRGAECVWETPLLNLARLRDRILEVKPRSLFVMGTADDYYDAGVLEHLREATAGRALIIEGADHSLELAGSVSGSLASLSQIVAAIEEFVGGGSRRRLRGSG